VGLADPVTVSLYEYVDQFGTGLVVVIGIVLKADDVTEPGFWIGVPMLNLPSTVIIVRIAEIYWYGAVVASPEGEIEPLVVGIPVGEVTRVRPVITRMVDDDIQDNADGIRCPVPLVVMGSLDKLHEVLLSAEVRIDV